MYLSMDVLINQPRNAGSSTSLTASIVLGIKFFPPTLNLKLSFVLGYVCFFFPIDHHFQLWRNSTKLMQFYFKQTLEYIHAFTGMYIYVFEQPFWHTWYIYIYTYIYTCVSMKRWHQQLELLASLGHVTFSFDISFNAQVSSACAHNFVRPTTFRPTQQFQVASANTVFHRWHVPPLSIFISMYIQHWLLF